MFLLVLSAPVWRIGTDVGARHRANDRYSDRY